MKMDKISEASPAKIGIFYLLFIVLIMVLCVWIIGTKTILMSAMAQKPYSVLLYENYFFGLVAEYHEHDSRDSEDSTRVICFGDSNSFYPPDYRVPRNANRGIHLSGLLHESIENSIGISPKVTFSDWSYVGATIFDYYCLFYEAEKFSPDLIIVSINWSSFGEAWLNNEDIDIFRPELSALVPIRSELPSNYEDPVRSVPISAVKQIGYKIDLYSLFPIGAKFWITERLRSLFGLRDRNNIFGLPEDQGEPIAVALSRGLEDEDEQSIRMKFDPFWPAAHKYFPMRIEDSNPSLRSLRALAYVASERGTKILFFIWPLDLEYLEEVGIINESALRRSRLLIKEAVVRENIFFADLSDMLEHRYFYDERGHCITEGRRRIAQALYPKVLEILDGCLDEQTAEPDLEAAE